MEGVRGLDALQGPWDPKGRRVFVRVDYNVPLAQGAGDVEVADDRRIRASLPTLETLLDRGAALVLGSHLGRPKGRVVEALRLAPVARVLSRLLGRPVQAARDAVGDEVEAQAAALAPGEVLLLENLRFHPGEKANEPHFADSLARLASLYVNDAFGTAHRAHASVVGLAERLPGVAGRLLEGELAAFDRVLRRPDRPFVVVLGGAKIHDKIETIENLRARADEVLVGGGMACTFLAARGGQLGASLVDRAALDVAQRLLEDAQGAPLRLPVDWVVAERIGAEAPTRVVAATDVPAGWMALDIGPQTRAHFAQRLAGARSILWNGPMGVFETPPFDAGTAAVAKAIGESGALSVVGGGDTARAVEQAGWAEAMSHVSTGGGAALDLLAGRELPGIRALRASWERWA